MKSLHREHSRLVVVTIPGDPATKGRPRLGKGGRVYTPAKTRKAEEAIGWAIRGELGIERFDSNVAVACIFYRATRQRVDTDNMLKAVLDGANKIAWEDDSQVTAVVGIAEYDPDNPRTVVALADHASTLARGKAAWRTCQQCGTRFDGKAQPIKYCSPECRGRARKTHNLREPVACQQCGEPFRRPNSGSKFCSTACAGLAARGRPSPKKVEPPRCVDCGMALARRSATRCRDCWRAAFERSREAA